MASQRIQTDSPTAFTLPVGGLYQRNNFDLIRLLAASQVALEHGIEHLHVTALEPLGRILALLPGVPAFFFMSGFLIAAAWERHPDWRVFYANRARRIFPALWAAVLLGLVTVVVCFDADVIAAHPRQTIAWLLAQGTVLQAWTPAFLQEYATGAVNGSLWTVGVELAFYATVPVIVMLKRRAVACAVLVSFALEYIAYQRGNVFPWGALMVSPAPWLGMFFLGMLAQSQADRLYRMVRDRAWWFAGLFVLVNAASAIAPVYPVLHVPAVPFRNVMGIANYLVLCLLLLAAAYSYRGLSDRWLRRNDLSYGIYIGHMLVINVLVSYHLFGLGAFGLAMLGTAGLAAASWVWIEKPALRGKRVSLYSHG